jgi:hypothetical protein
MVTARAYRTPADEDTDTLRRPAEPNPQQPLAGPVPTGELDPIDRIGAGHARSAVVSVMGPPNRAPGAYVMGEPDGFRGVDVMGGPDRGLGLGVMGGPDRGPRLDLMGESDPRFVGFVFTGLKRELR